jgi:putative membrane protein
MKRLLAGGLAGFIATAPMTAFMVFLYKRLPVQERFTWPPYKVTMKASGRIGLRRRQGPLDRLRLALAAHFGFGTVAGVVYSLLAKAILLPPVLTGPLYGLVVWSTSYLGWLPLVKLYQPPTRESPRRQAVMIAAHLIWGATLGLLFEQLHGRTLGVPIAHGVTIARTHGKKPGSSIDHTSMGEAPFGERG